jgi:hypothetical protein
MKARVVGQEPNEPDPPVLRAEEDDMIRKRRNESTEALCASRVSLVNQPG